MHTLFLTSVLVAGFAGGLGHDQITWSTPQVVFGALGAPSTVAAQHSAETFRMGEWAWSLSEDKLASAADFDGSPARNNVFAERWP